MFRDAMEAVAGSEASLTRLPDELPESLRRMELVAPIGYGAYAQVLEVHDSSNDKRYALKVIEKEPLKKRGMFPQLAREFGVQRALRHPNIAEVADLAEDATHAYMLLELCIGGSVWQATHGFPAHIVPETLAAHWLRGASRGTAHLHGHGIVHRDLKLENLLLDADGRVRLCDFGWCAFEADNPHGICGTPQLVPPEVRDGGPQTAKMDVWAIGACLVQLLRGSPLDGPWDAILPESASVEARGFGAACLSVDMDARIDIRGALRMPFLRGGSRTSRGPAQVQEVPQDDSTRSARTASPKRQGTSTFAAVASMASPMSLAGESELLAEVEEVAGRVCFLLAASAPDAPAAAPEAAAAVGRFAPTVEAARRRLLPTQEPMQLPLAHLADAPPAADSAAPAESCCAGVGALGDDRCRASRHRRGADGGGTTRGGRGGRGRATGGASREALAAAMAFARQLHKEVFAHAAEAKAAADETRILAARAMDVVQGGGAHVHAPPEGQLVAVG
mmetsp:Transcript_25462/g.85183  ORF Transcript_25462/g.85183 Transcript_25462/m.85183 type:complete len:507 (-) Transcript_25462:218-1738(-)